MESSRGNPAAGAEIYENTVVANIEEGPEHLVHTAGGLAVKAKSLVLATNAFTSKLGYFRNSIVPVHEFVAITPPLSDQQLAEIGWQKRAPFNDSRTEVVYLGLTREIGSTSAAEHPATSSTTAFASRPTLLHIFFSCAASLRASTPRWRASNSNPPGPE